MKPKITATCLCILLRNAARVCEQAADLIKNLSSTNVEATKSKLESQQTTAPSANKKQKRKIPTNPLATLRAKAVTARTRAQASNT